MRSILVDAGPLIALFDGDDAHHAAIKELLRGTAGRLITTWPVLTEVSHMLDFDVRAQLDFYGWVAAGGVLVHDLPTAALERIMDLVEKYRDRPKRSGSRRSFRSTATSTSTGQRNAPGS